jgi:uncharacterized protein (DUF2147 family)
MIATIKRAIGPLVISLAATCASATYAAASPLGLWYDNTGRAAVDIADCGGKLCGRLVWFKDAAHSKAGCNFQIIGNVKPVAGGKWDNGWIIDPEKDPNTKYDVEITLQGDKLKVMGYAGMKFLSQTMIWTRAPADLKRCTDTVAKVPEPAPAPAPSRSDEPPTVYPPPAATPAPSAAPDQPKQAERDPTPPPAAAAKPGKNCKVEFGGIVLTFPCPN